jgi:uncharacterized protein (DUF2384 family)
MVRNSAGSAPRPGSDPARVLTKAMLTAATRLGLSRRHLARVLGVSEPTLSRIGAGRHIEPTSKEGELALLFVRLFRSLDALVGGDEAKAGDWLHAGNRDLGDAPVNLIQSVEGLVHVVNYLDALRGSV